MFKNKMMCLWLFVAILSLSGFAFAGDLEPTDPPAPTMKTLDEIPPTWSQKLPVSERFEWVLDGEAILDKETGIVWEQAPTHPKGVYNGARNRCGRMIKGGRGGWALPTIQALTSLLVDVHAFGALPPGHPFELLETGTTYWSATLFRSSEIQDPGTDNHVWVVNFLTGTVATGNMTTVSGQEHLSWCVRQHVGHYDDY